MILRCIRGCVVVFDAAIDTCRDEGDETSESLQRPAIRNSDALPHLALILLTNLTNYDLVFHAFPVLHLLLYPL